MKGTGTAWGAATVLNAVAAWKGSAFAVGLQTRAEVVLSNGGGIVGDVPGVDTHLIARCVEIVLDRYGINKGGVVRTVSEIPVASGLKSSSAAANAAVLAALDAIGERMDLLDAAQIGVEAAKEVGVTITGAFDDACASILGGVVVTDNRKMELLRRDEMDSPVVLLVPDEKMLSSNTDVVRSRLLAPVAEVAFELALRGDYKRAMTLNGLLYCAALKRSTEPVMSALSAGAGGASLSGTGPSYAALVSGDCMEGVAGAWDAFGGRVIKTAINNRPGFTGGGT